MSMSSTEKTYEMLWDCQYCGAKKLLGLSQRYCPTCGGPQNPQKRYFPEENDKVAVEDHPYVGADLNCPACRQPMSARCNHCSNCGSPLQAGKAVAMQGEQQLGANGQWQAAGTPPPTGAPPKSNRLLVVIGLVVVALVALLVARATMKKDAEVTVSGHEWTRSIAIERYDEVDEKGPCKSMPSDARLVSRGKAEPTCTTKRVDNGDGTFKEKKECTEAVEQCTYKVDKWKETSKVKESGGLEREPVWPQPNLRLGNCKGCERPGTRSESYAVMFDGDGGKKHRCEFPEPARWKGFAKGSKLKAKINVVGGDLDCGSLK